MKWLRVIRNPAKSSIQETQVPLQNCLLSIDDSFGYITPMEYDSYFVISRDDYIKIVNEFIPSNHNRFTVQEI